MSRHLCLTQLQIDFFPLSVKKMNLLLVDRNMYFSMDIDNQTSSFFRRSDYNHIKKIGSGTASRAFFGGKIKWEIYVKRLTDFCGLKSLLYVPRKQYSPFSQYMTCTKMEISWLYRRNNTFCNSQAQEKIDQICTTLVFHLLSASVKPFIVALKFYFVTQYSIVAEVQNIQSNFKFFLSGGITTTLPRFSLSQIKHVYLQFCISDLTYTLFFCMNANFDVAHIHCIIRIHE